jgi:hypothetical protein
MTDPARKMARTQYLGADLTASQDRRLGRGKNIRIVEQGPSTWQNDAIQKRFRRPLNAQWDDVFAQAALPSDARPAGWDFVFVSGTVLGALGPELLFQQESYKPDPGRTGKTAPAADEPTYLLRLSIENESESLNFRENLRILSYAPGLRLLVIGRVNLANPQNISPLAIASLPNDAEDDKLPKLSIPDSLADRICMGFDEIQRHYLSNSHNTEVVLGPQEDTPENHDRLNPLRRRWIASMLTGQISQRADNAKILASEMTALKKSGFTTAAMLLDALSLSTQQNDQDFVEVFLASAAYLRTCELELARTSTTVV